MENSFLPYGQNEGPVSPFQEKFKSILGSTQSKLTTLEKKMLDKIKSITFVEFQSDNENTEESKMMQMIDWTSDLTSEQQDGHKISKRGISPRMRQAAISGWGALGAGFATDGRKKSRHHLFL